MILNGEKREVVVNGDFDSSGYSIQAGAKAFEVLSSNIYVNKIRAVIRELSTNALDIHKEVGKADVPFKVHLPTEIESWLTVRDYGTGLSREEAMYMYTTYFFSTRSDSNDYTGALGLGSKSPFAVADSFTVTSYHDGIKSVYSAYKDEDGCPQFAFLTEEESDEPCGLEVTVHVESLDFRRYYEEAIYVYKYFDTVPEINVPSVREQIDAALDGMWLQGSDFKMSHRYGRIVAVMGNVAYQIPERLVDMSCDGIMYFEIGELNFNPGREQLTLDDKTEEAIRQRFSTIKANAVEMIFEVVEREGTPWKKVKAYHAFETGTFGSWLKKDERHKAYHITADPTGTFKCMFKAGSRTTYNNQWYLPVGGNAEYFRNTSGATHRLRYHVRNNNVNAVMLTDEQIDNIGIDPEDVKDAMELPKPPRAARGTVPTVKTFTWNGGTSANNRYKADNWTATTVDVDSQEKIYIVISRWVPESSEYWRMSRVKNLVDNAKKMGIDIEYADVHGLKTAYTSTAAFRKGNWIELTDFIHREADACIKEREFTRYTGDRAALFTRIAEAGGPQEFVDFVEEHEKVDWNTPDILRSFKIEVEFDDSPDTMEELIMEQHPMLQFIDHLQTSDVDTVLQYVQRSN